MKLSTQPYRGARDFYPEDMRVRNYIFDTWKRVCRNYGFEEYDFPILEPFEIFAAKSGEELVNDQLFSFEDRGGRKLAIRPELTPGTVRMLAAKYGELIKPIRWFMIGNNWRYEKPQKGRGREFYQLEANIFDIEGVAADFEIFQLIIDIMRAFGANETQFQVRFSDRRLISVLLNDYLKLNSETQVRVRRLMDKRVKMSKEDFFSTLKDYKLTSEQQQTVESYMQSSFDTLPDILPSQILKQNLGFETLISLIKMLKDQNLMQFCKFDPSIIRGFDYSDGLVYEVFDQNPDNRRSMFGGERFDKLIQIFNPKYDMGATGFAMGDYTLLEFLKVWNLLPTFPNETKVFIASLDESAKTESFRLAENLRNQGINTIINLEDAKLDKQFKYADKKGIPWVVIIGPEEVEAGKVKLKNMRTGEQEMVDENRLIDKLR